MRQAGPRGEKEALHELGESWVLRPVREEAGSGSSRLRGVPDHTSRELPPPKGQNMKPLKFNFRDRWVKLALGGTITFGKATAGGRALTRHNTQAPSVPRKVVGGAISVV